MRRAKEVEMALYAPSQHAVGIHRFLCLSTFRNLVHGHVPQQ